MEPYDSNSLSRAEKIRFARESCRADYSKRKPAKIRTKTAVSNSKEQKESSNHGRELWIRITIAVILFAFVALMGVWEDKNSWFPLEKVHTMIQNETEFNQAIETVTTFFQQQKASSTDNMP